MTELTGLQFLQRLRQGVVEFEDIRVGHIDLSEVTVDNLSLINVTFGASVQFGDMVPRSCCLTIKGRLQLRGVRFELPYEVMGAICSKEVSVIGPSAYYFTTEPSIHTANVFVDLLS